jgi:hypothetical protein
MCERKITFVAPVGGRAEQRPNRSANVCQRHMEESLLVAKATTRSYEFTAIGKTKEMRGLAAVEL